MKMQRVLAFARAAGPLWQDRLMGDAITKKLDKPIIFPQNKLGHFHRAFFSWRESVTRPV
jgi:hypothetical protein